LTTKSLPKNAYFQDELIVSCPDCIRLNSIGIGVYNKELITLNLRQGEVYLNYYTIDGKFRASHMCTFSDMSGIAAIETRELIACNNHFYLACGNKLLRISHNGEINVVYHAAAPIGKIAVYLRYDLYTAIACIVEDRVVFILEGKNSFDTNGMEAVALSVLHAEQFVVAEKRDVWVYDVWETTTSLPEFLKKIETQNDVVSVFPGPLRDQIGVLESTGQITLHNIRESD
jgi:hypothetical protein